MRIGVLLYEGFVDFEISMLLLLLKEKGDICFVSADDMILTSYGRLKVCADERIEEVDPTTFDLLVIPGGEPKAYADRSDIQSFISQAHGNGTIIAAICGGPEFLAQAGVLKGKHITHGHDPEYAARVFSESIIEDADVVVDGNIITARGQAYAEFAVEVHNQLGFFESESERDETLRWMKNIHQ